MLIDFGIARSSADSTMTRSGVMLGTPQFMAPEQLRGRGTVVGPAADVFALAGVLCYAETGAYPFGDGLPEQMLYRVAHEEPDLTEVDPALRRVLRKCLAKEPAERPTAAELAAILSLDLRTLALTADPDVTPTEVLRPVEAAEEAEERRRKPWKPSLSWDFSLRWVWVVTLGAGMTTAAVLLVLVMPGRPAHGSDQPQAGATSHAVVTTPATAGTSTAPSPIGSASLASASPPALPSPNQPVGGQVPSSAPTGPGAGPATLPPTTTPAAQPPVYSSPAAPPPATAAAPPPPPPTTPQPVAGVTLTPQGPSCLQMQLSWSAQSNTTSYDILYHASLQPGEHEVDGATGTSTTISAIPQDTVCVQMRAVNQYGKSAWSPSSPVCVRNWN